MRKIILISILALAVSSLCFAAEKSIESLLGLAYGEICIVKAEFIEKPNSYYAQNISPAEYYLKIIEINQKKLSKPIIVEPVYEGIEIELGKVYVLKAYETIASEGSPQGWTEEVQQFTFNISRRIVIKIP